MTLSPDQIGSFIPGLRRYARALLRDVTAADDLVQDCLERALTHWSQKRSDNIRSWLFAILHNLAINRLKQKQKRGAHVTLDDAPEAAMSRPATQEEQLHFSDLARAVDSLPEDQRTVLLLVSVEGLAYAETARVLNVPLGTVMSRLSRARDRLSEATDGQVAGASRIAAQALRRVK